MSETSIDKVDEMKMKGQNVPTMQTKATRQSKIGYLELIYDGA